MRNKKGSTQVCFFRLFLNLCLFTKYPEGWNCSEESDDVIVYGQYSSIALVGRNFAVEFL